jgi:hypothetical protein
MIAAQRCNVTRSTVLEGLNIGAKTAQARNWMQLRPGPAALRKSPRWAMAAVK